MLVWTALGCSPEAPAAESKELWRHFQRQVAQEKESIC